MPAIQPPITLHVHRPTPNYAGAANAGYHHGAPEWSEGFSSYLTGALPQMVAEARWRKAHWWTQPDLLSALRTARVVSETALAGLLAWRAEGRSYRDVSAEYRKGQFWLARNLRTVERTLESWNISMRQGSEYRPV